jgi:streptogramin lyase
MNHIYRNMAGILAALVGIIASAHAGLLPGLGEVSGAVTGPTGAVIPVYLYNKEKSVGYSVFAVDGTYRAVDVFPGHYEITLGNGHAPSKDSYEMAPVAVDVVAGGHAHADLAPKEVAPTQNYTGRINHADGEVAVEPYDTVYPPGAGRQILERTCIVCHGVSFIPSKHGARETWEALIHLMINGPANGGLFAGSGLIAGPPVVDPARINAQDMPVLLDYLVANFGPDSKPRDVLQDEWPAVDREALAKAMYIEYRFPNSPTMKRRVSQELHFDQNGNVYVSDPGEHAIVRVDPRTGESKTNLIPSGNSSHGITVDGDGTVWFAGAKNFVAHLDPKTGLFDQYPATELGLHGNTPVFTSNGDIWFSMLIGNKIGHWERATNQVTYYDSPVPDADPYGLEVDHHDKIWYCEYFAGAVVRFDPVTKTFRRFEVKTSPVSLRRLGVDSKDNIWYGVYGHMGKYGKLGRIDAKSGEITEIDVPVEYSHPYDARPDPEDNIWIASMNYLTKFDPKTKRFTVYPTPERTDEPKIQATRDGAIWFPPRGAGIYGYGGAAVVLYPDKDHIKTLGAYYSADMTANRISLYHGPFTRVTGAVYWSKDGAQNPDVPGEKTRGKLREPGKAGAEGGGASRED